MDGLGNERGSSQEQQEELNKRVPLVLLLLYASAQH